MTILLQLIETQLVALVAPLVVSDDIKAVQVEPFTGATDLDDLLDRFRSRMPGAFLSPPAGKFSTEGVRTLDAELSFSILVGFSERDDPHTRVLRAYAVFERLLAVLSLRSLVIPPGQARMDYLRPQSFDIVQSDQLIALLVQFGLGVRNWRVNEPE